MKVYAIKNGLLSHYITRYNGSNWVNGSLPHNNSVILFPASLGDFGNDQCITPGAPCPHGTLISVGPDPKKPTAKTSSLTVGRLELPFDLKIEFMTNTVLTFNTIDPTLPEDKWLVRGDWETDFRCAANWVVKESGTNPAFVVPCYTDTVYFAPVCSLHLFPPFFCFCFCFMPFIHATQEDTFSVVVPDHTYIAGASTTNMAELDRYEFSGYPWSFDPSSCPEPYGTGKGPQFCLLWCVNSCPQLQPNGTIANQTVLDNSKSLLNYTQTAIDAANYKFGNESIPIAASGAVFFPAPGGTDATVIATVAQQAQSALGPLWTLPTTISVRVRICKLLADARVLIFFTFTVQRCCLGSLLHRLFDSSFDQISRLSCAEYQLHPLEHVSFRAVRSIRLRSIQQGHQRETTQ